MSILNSGPIIILTCFLNTACQSGYMAASSCNIHEALGSHDVKLETPEAAEFAAALSIAKKYYDRRWKMQGSPILQNILVYSNFRKCGWCNHWSHALYSKVNDHTPEGYRLVFLYSKKNSPKEHHVLCLHDEDEAWVEGVIIDGWSPKGWIKIEPVKESDRTWGLESEQPSLWMACFE